jgi:Zn-finger nucleic acid-binding protein
MKTMICPNDNVALHQVKIEGHYGEPIFLDQCDKCGGLWFDKAELYRAKQGQADKIELVNTQSLWTPSVIEHSRLFCPRDGAQLIQLQDKNLPKGIIIERCPSCDGFWLNRGEFCKYQQVREQRLRSREQSPNDVKFKEEVQRLLALHQSDESNSTLGRIGRLLNTPIDTIENETSESVESTPAELPKFDLVISILTFLFRAFITRFPI